MPYTFTYTNRQCQFGKANYTLILEDIDGVLPTVRIEKSFPEEWDYTHHNAEAAIEIHNQLTRLEQVEIGFEETPQEVFEGKFKEFLVGEAD